MSINIGDKVRIQSSNDVLKAYEKARTPFIVRSIYGGNVTLFYAESGKPFEVVLFDFEIVPYAI